MQKYLILAFALFSSHLSLADGIPAEMTKIETMIQISEMYGRDQGIRQSWFYLSGKGFSLNEINNDAGLKARTLEIDKANSEALKKIVAEYGWPSIKTFSKVTDYQAWIIVQHADHDLDFQEAMLRLIREEAKNKNTSLSNFAYLHDRVNFNKKNPQVYGTQGGCKGKGNWTPYDLKEPEKLDAYRKSVDLPPMEEFKKRMNGSCV